MPQVAAVVVAAGQGLRAGGDMPKQFREIGGASLLRRSLLGFAGVPAVSALQPVVRKDDIDLVREHTRDIRILPPVFGGATRQASVRGRFDEDVCAYQESGIRYQESVSESVSGIRCRTRCDLLPHLLQQRLGLCKLLVGDDVRASRIEPEGDVGAKSREHVCCLAHLVLRHPVVGVAPRDQDPKAIELPMTKLR